MVSNGPEQEDGSSRAAANVATPCPLAEEASTSYLVRFLSSNETAVCSYEEGRLAAGQAVIAVSRYGKDLAQVLGPVNSACFRDRGTIMPLVRLAEEHDRATFEKNLPVEERASDTCAEKVENHALPMKILKAHLLPEENKLLFFFAAEGRVDFRELVRDLVSTFHMRIELRQIGVRDETRLLGGVGVCGRVLCCHAYPDQICSVSIKMAKEQNLSLGSMKASGPCGRLMCCLSYEYSFYAAEQRRYPRPGTVVTALQSRYVVCDVNMISGTVALASPEGGIITAKREQLDHDGDQDRWSADLSTQGDEE